MKIDKDYRKEVGGCCFGHGGERACKRTTDLRSFVYEPLGLVIWACPHHVESYTQKLPPLSRFVPYFDFKEVCEDALETQVAQTSGRRKGH